MLFRPNGGKSFFIAKNETEVRRVATDEKREWAVTLLRQKAQELGQIPKKDDFDEVTRSRIKAFLGPWPRALEAAGLKEPPKKPARPRNKKGVRG